MPIINIGLDIAALKAGATKATAILKGVASSAGEAAKSAGILTAALSKVAAQVLALAGAYKALDNIKFFAQRGIEFNKTTEKTQVAISSMVASMSQLENEQGKLLTGAEKYAAAQGIASDMLQEVQRAALSSSVPVELLVAGMQDITDTAFQAGLKLKEIPQFTVAASEAMQKLGIPVTQMRAEMDALLTGGIKKSKGLASFLEIDQKTVNAWKEQGVYIENVLARLKEYQGESANVAHTLESATTSLKNSISILSGDMTKGLNDSLKESVKSLQTLFVTSKDGTNELSQDFANVAVVIEQAESAIGDTILSLTQTFTASVRDLNEAIGSGAAADTFDSVKTAVFTLTAALTSLKVIRSDTVRQTKDAIASELQYAETISSGRAVILSSAEANRQRAAAALEAARAENTAAQAALVSAQAYVRDTTAKLQNATTAKQVEKATKNLENAQKGLTNAQERAKITGDALTAAQIRLDTATKKAAATSTGWSIALDTMRAGAAKVEAAFRGLWAAMGGSVGIAITALVTGLTYLTTRQTDAERTTKALQEAQEIYARVTKDAVDETGKLTRELDALGRRQLELAQRDLAAAMESQIKEISDTLTSALQKVITTQARLTSETEAFAGFLGNEYNSLFKLVPPQFEKDLNDLLADLKNGKIDATRFGESLFALKDKFIEAGHAQNAFVAAIDNLNKGNDNTINRLRKAEERSKLYEEALKGSANTVKESARANKDYTDTIELIDKMQKKEINSAKDAVEWLQKRTQGTNTMKTATEENARAADTLALAKIREAEAIAQGTYMMAQATAIIAENREEANKAAADALKNWEAATKAREQFEKGLQELYQKPISGAKSVSGGGGSGGASQIESARQSIARLRDEIAALNGTMSKDSGGLAKKTAEIEKMGKQAKMSAAEIKALQTEYAAAFKADTLKEFDKAVLQIEGDTAALKQIEIADTLKEWGLRFHDLGMDADQAAPYIDRLKKALETQEAYKDLQTAADFYKDLASLSGEYGQSLEYQNKLIDEQAKLWIEAGIPLADVEKRVELMRQDLSRDMFSGLVRGVRKFGSEYGDMAAQVESFTTQMGSHISNTLADAFMKGKFSAKDFFNSLISMAAQAASNAFIGQIFSGIGGLFSGGMSTFSEGALNLTSYIPGISRHSGGMVDDSGPSRMVPLSAYANAPRFHSGGGYFSSDEYPAILLRGERVLNRQETAAYNAGHAASLPMGGKQDVTVNVINQTRQNVEAQTEARQDANGALNLDIILKQVDSGMAGLARQGKSAFGSYMQNAYGLDRANTIMQRRGRA